MEDDKAVIQQQKEQIAKYQSRLRGNINEMC
jgi:hypothetical protein